MRRWALHLVLAGALAGAAGCTTYQTYAGPKQPRHKVAMLDVPGPVTEVDGDPVNDRSARRLTLLPGWHEVEWTFDYPNGHRAGQKISFVAQAGNRYRLGQRFFPAPHPGGPVGAIVEIVFDAAFLPIKLLLEEPPADAPPPGDYYCWIVERGTEQVVAGMAPDVPMAHAEITYVPVGEDIDSGLTAGAPEP